jgi:DnaJ-class molecular chaperone
MAEEDIVNYYHILEIDDNATFKEIKLSYKRLADAHHPDKMAQLTDEQKGEFEKSMKLINEAKDVLTDPVKRAKFDQKMGRDMNQDLRRLRSFRPDASLTSSRQAEGSYGEPSVSYDHSDKRYGISQVQAPQPGYGAQQGSYATPDYGQNWQENRSQRPAYSSPIEEPVTYQCPYCSSRFRMQRPREITIMACPNCKNNITIYPE